MKLAVIDVGSNAVRLQITKVLEYERTITFKKLEYIRFPLRLGQDVFSNNKISEYNERRFYHLMTAFKHLIDLYEVDEFYGCATSAMREAENGKYIAEQVNQKTGLMIHIISGDEESELINKVILFELDNRNYIHIDVGGGSTEFNIYKKREKKYSKSFQIGSVRRLGHFDQPKIWDEMSAWVREHCQAKGKRFVAIGTGGNINKLYELMEINSKPDKMDLDQLMGISEGLKKLSVTDRLYKLQLNPDRADVIVPASEIYIEAMRQAQAKYILIPNIGLKDGLNYYIYKKLFPNSNKVILKN